MRLVRESIYEGENPYFKGPSRERIEKAIVGMSLEERFDKAIENNVLWLVKQCLDDGVDPTVNHNEAIQLAAGYGHTETVRLLLSDKRVDPSVNHNWAIRCAADNGHTEIVRLLLSDKRVDPTDANNLAIRWAASNGHTEIVKELLKDKRVRDKLSKEEKIKYKEYLKNTPIKESLNSKFDIHLNDNFWNWFKGSKVIDKDGNPLLVYHGTKSIFNEFKPSKKIGNQGETDQIEGIYFTDNIDGASWYSLVDNNERYLKSVYLSIKNPYIIDNYKKLKEELNIEKLSEAKDKITNLGYDGIIMKNGFYSNGGPYKLFLVFEPNQIKSINKHN